MRIREVLENIDSFRGRVFDGFIQVLIVLSLISFSLETLPNLTVTQKNLLKYTEYFFISVFTIEYIVRVYAAESRSKFVFSFFGIIDFLSVAPFYIFAGADFRYLRAVRLLRLVRTLKLVRYSKAASRIHQALLIAREEIVLYLFFTVLLLFFASVGIYFFENRAQPEVFSSVFHSLWWSVTTLTTVGYGDAYPITVGGRIFTFFVLIIGLGVVAVPAGLVSSALATARKMEEEE